MLRMKSGIRRALAGSAVVCSALLLAACGGGGGDPGTSTFGGGSGTGTGGGTTTTATASDLVLVMSTAVLPNDGTQVALATATAVDAKRNVLADIPVSIAVDSGGIAAASGSKTDATGAVTASIAIGSNRSNRTITVTATSGSLTRTAAVEVRDPSSSGATGASLLISVAATVVTPASPTTATLILRSSTGLPVANAVVSLSTARANLALLSKSSVLTDATGGATVQVQAAPGGLSGADEIVAVATVGNVQVSGRQGFAVEGAAPTLNLSASATTLRSSLPAATLTAIVRDARGLAVAGQLVAFSATGAVALSAATGLSNASGVVSVKATPANGAVSAAGTVTATATVAGVNVQGAVGLEVIAEQPRIELALSNSSVSLTQPAVLRATVRDASGALLPGAIVSFGSQFNLLTFDASTRRTEADGVASVSVSPRSGSVGGGDVITASVTIGSATQSQQASVQVAGAVASGSPVLQLTLSSTSISAALPGTVTSADRRRRHRSGRPGHHLQCAARPRQNECRHCPHAA